MIFHSLYCNMDNDTSPLSPMSGNNTLPTKADMKRVRIGAAGRRKNFKRVIWAGITVVVLGGVTFGMIQYSNRRARSLPGVFVVDQGREHVGPGHQHTYNSNPPTSGPHFARPEEWGAYKDELPDEVLIHNLEHGGVWISYKPDVSEDIRKKLEALYDKWGRKVIVTPRAKNDADIALAAWNHLDKFSAAEFSEERVEKFVRAFRNKGPEFVP